MNAPLRRIGRCRIVSELAMTSQDGVRAGMAPWNAPLTRIGRYRVLIELAVTNQGGTRVRMAA
jgi:hypothetical protein